MGELLPLMWYSKDYGGEHYRAAVLFNLAFSVYPPLPLRLRVHIANVPLPQLARDTGDNSFILNDLYSKPLSKSRQ